MLVMGYQLFGREFVFMARGIGELLETKAPRVPFPFFSLFNDDDGDDDGGGDDAGKYYLLQMRRIRFLGALQVDLLRFYCPALPWDFIDLLFSSFSLSGPGALCS